MITKKLIHQVITFLNNYLYNVNIVTGYTYYGINYISVNFAIWNVENGFLEHQIANYDRYIENENDFNKFKEEVTNNIDKDLNTVLSKAK